MEGEENLEAGGAPEVSEVAEAPPAEPAVEVEAETSDPSQSVASEPDDAAPASFPSAEEFGWDEWDGGHEGLPEPLRPWGEKFGGYYAKQVEDQVAARVEALDRSAQIYRALLDGNDDPRLKEYQDQLAVWETKYNTLNSDVESEREKFLKYQEAGNSSIEAEAKEYADWFQRTNPDLYEDENKGLIFAGLLEEGWEMETAAEAARLSVPEIRAAREAKNEGVPDAYAIRLAVGAKKSSPAPRPGAKITAGATTPVRSAEQTAAEPPRPSNLRDLRSSIAAKALKQHSNSRRR